MSLPQLTNYGLRVGTPRRRVSKQRLDAERRVRNLALAPELSPVELLYAVKAAEGHKNLRLYRSGNEIVLSREAKGGRELVVVRR